MPGRLQLRELSKTTPEQNKRLVWGASTRCSKKVATRRQSVIGLPTTSSTVLISSRATSACSYLARSLPATLKYEYDLIVPEGDYVISRGRFSGRGSPVNWIAADIVRIEKRVLG